MRKMWAVGNFVDGSINLQADTLPVIKGSDSFERTINGDDIGEFQVLRNEIPDNWKSYFASPERFVICYDADASADDLRILYAGFINKIDTGLRKALKIQATNIKEYAASRRIVAFYKSKYEDPTEGLELGSSEWAGIMSQLIANLFSTPNGLPSNAPKPPNVLGYLPTYAGGTTKTLNTPFANALTYAAVLDNIRDTLSDKGNEYRFNPRFADSSKSRVIWDVEIGSDAQPHIRADQSISIPLDGSGYFKPSGHSMIVDSSEKATRMISMSKSGSTEDQDGADLSWKVASNDGGQYPILLDGFFNPGYELSDTEMNEQLTQRLNASLGPIATVTYEVVEGDINEWMGNLGKVANFGGGSGDSSGMDLTVRIISVKGSASDSLISVGVMVPQARYPKLPTGPSGGGNNDTSNTPIYQPSNPNKLPPPSGGGGGGTPTLPDFGGSGPIVDQPGASLISDIREHNRPLQYPDDFWGRHFQYGADVVLGTYGYLRNNWYDFTLDNPGGYEDVDTAVNAMFFGSPFSSQRTKVDFYRMIFNDYTVGPGAGKFADFSLEDLPSTDLTTDWTKFIGNFDVIPDSATGRYAAVIGYNTNFWVIQNKLYVMVSMFKTLYDLVEYTNPNGTKGTIEGYGSTVVATHVYSADYTTPSNWTKENINFTDSEGHVMVPFNQKNITTQAGEVVFAGICKVKDVGTKFRGAVDYVFSELLINGVESKWDRLQYHPNIVRIKAFGGGVVEEVTNLTNLIPFPYVWKSSNSPFPGGNIIDNNTARRWRAKYGVDDFAIEVNIGYTINRLNNPVGTDKRSVIVGASFGNAVQTGYWDSKGYVNTAFISDKFPTPGNFFYFNYEGYQIVGGAKLGQTEQAITYRTKNSLGSWVSNSADKSIADGATTFNWATHPAWTAPLQVDGGFGGYIQDVNMTMLLTYGNNLLIWGEAYNGFIKTAKITIPTA